MPYGPGAGWAGSAKAAPRHRVPPKAAAELPITAVRKKFRRSTITPRMSVARRSGRTGGSRVRTVGVQS
ncbi:hypothetical protein GCM10010284_22330 [Streptomyces rubiginosohelvolus]|nr:hypothetical protein GCM10010284_22330 [Streptomyces rubiginosohelvolus]